MDADPSLRPRQQARQRARFRDLVDTARRGLSPGYLDIVKCGWRYFQPSYHPSREGSTGQAVAYLGSSPAALAADGQ
jgi:predicted metal-dependent hydrolase